VFKGLNGPCVSAVHFEFKCVCPDPKINALCYSAMSTPWRVLQHITDRMVSDYGLLLSLFLALSFLPHTICYHCGPPPLILLSCHFPVTLTQANPPAERFVLSRPCPVSSPSTSTSTSTAAASRSLQHTHTHTHTHTHGGPVCNQRNLAEVGSSLGLSLGPIVFIFSFRVFNSQTPNKASSQSL